MPTTRRIVDSAPGPDVHRLGMMVAFAIDDDVEPAAKAQFGGLTSPFASQLGHWGGSAMARKECHGGGAARAHTAAPTVRMPPLVARSKLQYTATASAPVR